MRVLVFLSTVLLASHAAASEFHCAGTKKRIDRFDIVQAYSGQPVLVGKAWVTACMLPPHLASTRAAFAQLPGVSAEAAEILARPGNLVDRGIRVVRDEMQMEACMVDNQPSVGYFAFKPASREVVPCF